MLNCNTYNPLVLTYICHISMQKKAKVSETGLYVKFKGAYEIQSQLLLSYLPQIFHLVCFRIPRLSGLFFSVSFDAKWDGWMSDAGQRRVESKEKK